MCVHGVVWYLIVHVRHAQAWYVMLCRGMVWNIYK